MNQAVRKAENEGWFRDLNERLEDRAAGRATSDGPFEIVCECAREECTERIPISFSEYEAVRASSTTFVVAPGHHDLAVERHVASREHYDLVEKLGVAGLVAEIEDPRDAVEPGDQAEAD